MTHPPRRKVSFVSPAASFILAAIALPLHAGAWSFVFMGNHRAETGINPGVNTSVVAVLAADIAEHEPDLVLIGGDMINGGGADLAGLAAQYNSFKTALEPIINAGIPFYPVAGNHEFWGSTNELVSQYEICAEAWHLAFGQNLPQNGPADELGLTYAFTHKNARFLGLNVYTSQTYKGVATAWVSNQLAANTSPHVFAFSHEPMSYVSEAGKIENRNEFWRLLGRANARLCFGGNLRHVERTITATPDNNRHYIHDIANGAGGAPLDGSGAPAWPEPNDIALANAFYNNTLHGYTLVSIDGDKVDASFRCFEPSEAGPVWHDADAFGYGRLDYSNTIAEITDSIANAMAGNAVMGMVIALVDGSNTVWQQGFGFADLEQGLPVAADTVFHIGSVSKTFTATALFQLWDQGRFLPDDDVIDHIPEFALMPRFTNAPNITVKNLLNHQSGIPGDIFNGMFTFNRQVTPKAWTDWLIAYLKNDYPSAPPDTMFAYCNSGWVLAGEIVGRLSGVGLETYAENAIFKPLGMNSTSYLPDKPVLREKLARSYTQGFLMPDEFISAPATGGMLSCAPDMAKFLAMLIADGVAPDGSRIISSQALAEMRTQQGTNLPLNVYQSIFPGMGWDFAVDPFLRHAGHAPCKNGATLFHCSFLCYLPEQKLGVFVAQNSPGNQCDTIGRQTLKLAALDKVGLQAPTNTTPPFSPLASRPQSELDALAGVYAATADRGYSRVTAAQGSLNLSLLADTDTPLVLTNLVPRQNGWFSTPNSQSFQITFTNLDGYFVMLAKTFDKGFEFNQILGERFDPQPLSAAWTNRLGRTYVAADMQADDLRLDLSAFTLNFWTSKEVLLLNSMSGIFVIEPADDSLAFARGLPMRWPPAVAAVNFYGNELLRYGGCLFQDAGSISSLPVGVATQDATVLTNGIAWRKFNAVSGARYRATINGLSTHFYARLFNPDFEQLVPAQSNVLDWTCSEEGVYYLAFCAPQPQPFTARLSKLPASGINDFDGDRVSDLTIYDRATGNWYIRSPGGKLILWAEPWGAQGFITVAGDYNADGAADLAVYDQAAGLWYVRGIDGTPLFWGVHWGGPNLIPVAGDFDGDGRQDFAVYHENSGSWFILGANGKTLLFDASWGGPGLIPVPGDYNAAGAADLAVYDTASGKWYKRDLAGNILLWGEPWGGPGLIPVPGDYNADGASDLAVYDTASGNWYARGADGATILWAEPFGGQGFLPVPGDYNGDGASDLAVYDTASGNWYARGADGAIILWAEPWGGPGLIPAVFP